MTPEEIELMHKHWPSLKAELEAERRKPQPVPIESVGDTCVCCGLEIDKGCTCPTEMWCELCNRCCEDCRCWQDAPLFSETRFE